MQHPDKETRISVYKSIFGGLKKGEEIHSSALRNICSDWVKTVKRRNYDSPIHRSLIDNGTTQEIISNLMKTVENNINIYQKFLKIKAKLLNLPKLDGVDVWANLPSEKRYSWDEAKQICFQVYNNFDVSFGNVISDIFERNHIDTSSREGKIAGAWCYYWYNGRSVFILTPFKGLISDIFPLTHELGHGIHFYLASREQTLLNSMPGMTMQETASTFGELLLADHLLETIDSTNERISLLTNQLTMGGLLIFILSSWMLFEQSLYHSIDREEYLDGKAISKYWCAARNKMYGDSVEFFDDMKWEWIPVPHFYMASRRFYNYPYVFAELIVLGLYNKYREEGESFVPKYKEFLKAGGSESPEAIAKKIGLDLNSEEFWLSGIREIRRLFEELKKYY